MWPKLAVVGRGKLSQRSSPPNCMRISSIRIVGTDSVAAAEHFTIRLCQCRICHIRMDKVKAISTVFTISDELLLLLVASPHSHVRSCTFQAYSLPMKRPIEQAVLAMTKTMTWGHVLPNDELISIENDDFVCHCFYPKFHVRLSHCSFFYCSFVSSSLSCQVRQIM